MESAMTAHSGPIPELTAINEAIERARTSSPELWNGLQEQSEWEIFTDGSAPIKNPGGAIGFSAVFLLDKKTAWEVYGGTAGRTKEPATSNNRAEIAGVLTILEVVNSLKKENLGLPSSIEIVCDSQYVVNCAQGKWKKHKNKDLWNRFDQLMCVVRQNKIKLKFRWTRAHVGTEWNERADVLAKEGAFLAINKRVTEDFKAPQVEIPVPIKEPTHHYSLKLYSEMLGQSDAKGVYRLATSRRERQVDMNIDDVITLDEAEYKLLIEGLSDLLHTLKQADREPKKFDLLVESTRDLMLKQVQGIYGVKSERLQPLHKRVIAATRSFRGVRWEKLPKNELKAELKSW